MKVSIVIPTYNNLSFLKPCIDSVVKYTDMSDAEIIVVANGCKEDTADYLESLSQQPYIKVVWDDKPRGYSAATNMGIQASSGDYVILLNDDTVILHHEQGGWINRLLKPFNDQIAISKVGITGPLTLSSSETGSKFVVFFCAAISRQLFEKIGTLNEMFGVGFGEDMEFCWRAEQAGYGIVDVGGARSFDDKQKLHVTTFPLYHAGEATVKDYDGGRIVKENCAKLKSLVNSRKPLPRRSSAV